MAGYENIKDHGFDKRTAEERRELAIKAGKASGEARRRKADFRKTLNLLLTTKIDSPEWTPLLESLGLDSTLESALNMAMIKEGLSGNVKAYEAVARYAGQSDRTVADEEEQSIRTDRARRARDQELGDNDGSEENIQSFLMAMNPSQEDMDNLFAEEEVAGGEETEETGEI
ncbi:hypothetical protein [Blautia producta]|uniref:hypothetical protein n=1 Tax=Blautia producta TaxID=33035 RepID=UPI0031B650E3